MSHLPDIHRLLPQSADAEQGILSSFLLAPNEIGQLCAEKNVTREFFHIPAHAMIYEVLTELWRDNEPIDVILLTQVLRDRNVLDHVGGAAFITELFTFLPTAANAGYYIGIAEEKKTLRQIIKMCTEYASRSYEQQGMVTELLGGLEEEMLRLVKLRYGQSIHSRTMAELVQRSSARLDEAMNGTGEIDMPTGIPELDLYLGGFRAPEVTILAGKPSEGKTAASLNFAEHLAVPRAGREGKRVGIISMEMSDDQLADRLMGSMAWVNLREIRRERTMTDHEHGKWVAAAKRLAEAKIYIRDDGALSMPEIGATFAMWKSRHGLDLGIIDHAQLIRGEGKADGRTEEMEQISRALKPMAKRLDIPLLVLSQVTDTQAGGYRTKNSTALTEDADNVILITKKEGHRFLTIAKQRDGERNRDIPVTFIESLGRFKSVEDPDPQPELQVQKDSGKKASTINGKSRY